MSEYGTCATCGTYLRLAPDGTVRKHKSPWNARYVCKGSHKEPEPAPERAA